jgi:hypothetical protein
MVIALGAPLTSIEPSTPVIVPLLTMAPINVVPLLISMAVLPEVIVPLLVMPPANVEKPARLIAV